MTHEKPETLPWHFPVRVDDVPEEGRHFVLTADDATKAAVARYSDVGSVERLEASFDVTRKGRSGLRVTGEVRAVVGQTCVVSLEPIENEVAEAVDVDFVPAPQGQSPGSAETLPNSEDGDGPEFLVDGAADLGALAVEFLILGIDPYPRKSGVDFVAPKADEAGTNPFAALAKLKKEPDAGK